MGVRSYLQNSVAAMSVELGVQNRRPSSRQRDLPCDSTRELSLDQRPLEGALFVNQDGSPFTKH